MKSRTVFCNLLLFFFLSGIDRTAAAQEWSVHIRDINAKDRSGNLDKIHAVAVEFMPDGKTIVTAGYSYNGTTKNASGEVRLRDVIDGSIKVSLQGTARWYDAISHSGALAVSPDGKLIAATGRTRRLRGSAIDLFDPKAQKLVRTFGGRGVGGFSCVKFSSDSKMLVA
jgi:Tol biopolymer transport system component